MKFLVFESNEIHPNAIKLLKEKGFHVQTEIESEGNKKEIEAFFIRSYTKVTPAILDEFPNLKYILRAGVGLENVDLKACEKRGIKVINSPGSNANAVSELVICFMILLIRKIPLQIDLLRHGTWRNKEKIGSELKNKTIGFIGCGAVGRLVTEKLLSFDVHEILAYDPYLDKKTLKERNAKKSTIDDVLKKSDIITLHLPLNNETRGLIGKDKLALIKKGAYIINSSRGGILNEEGLINALKNEQIGGAALDVFEHEPNFNQELLQFPNVILTPHIGAFSQEADEKMAVQAVENFLKNYKKYP
jgi:D-3-phosphoglycerate dehydrogenase